MLRFMVAVIVARAVYSYEHTGSLVPLREGRTAFKAGRTYGFMHTPPSGEEVRRERSKTWEACAQDRGQQSPSQGGS